MSFYLIVNTANKNKHTLAIQDACEKRGINLEVLDMETLDMLNLPTLTKSDILYRVATSKKARIVEKLLLNDDCTHIYKDTFAALSSHGGSYFHQHHLNLPVIPTVPFIPDSREQVETAVAQLGGFPLVVKVIGGSLGVGVIKVDSKEGIHSLLDYLRNKNISTYLRKFVDHDYYVRVVVLGGKVIASHATYSIVDEFRTNVEDPSGQRREAVQLSPEVQEIAVLAAEAVRADFAGIDILFDKEEHPHIAEINTPFDFMCTQNITKIDIADQLVAFLVEKSRQ